MPFSDASSSQPPQKIAIVGGGLAGLSVAFHFLKKAPSVSRISVYDVASVGQGGASAVAGGLVHPLSPRGKLVHLGIECLETTKTMVDYAVEARRNSTGDPAAIILSREIMRVATSQTQVEQLQKTASAFPDYCQWIEDATRIQKEYHTTSSILGGLRLTDCLVLHVPSYLQGLWMACEKMAKEKGCTIEWIVTDRLRESLSNESMNWSAFDATVLAAGAGLFRKQLHDERSIMSHLPVQLVRGQSVEIQSSKDLSLQSALLCGKYVSPLPRKGSLLIGATHEFKDEALSQDEVISSLQESTNDFYPWHPSSVERLTQGYRVQSQRGKHGRRPVVGSLRDWPHHENTYIFTGLSSRGLLYHGYYGSALVDQMLGRESFLPDEEFDWWRPM